MELDRNRAAEHDIPCDIVERLGKGRQLLPRPLVEKARP